MLAGYAHLLEVAARRGWDEAAIDLSGDARAWPATDRPELLALLCGFRVAEHAVADHLTPFVTAAPEGDAAACFAAQQRDEARHARFFDRVVREVCAVEDPRRHVAPAITELFEVELPATARRLGDRGDLGHGVALYHLVLEGVAFASGQDALLERLDEAGDLPGVREGVVRVQADERWHVGLGVVALAELGAPALREDLDALVETAVACWDLAPAAAQQARRVHRRRVREALAVATG